MERFFKIFKKQKCNVIGMIHVGALPGTPKYENNLDKLVTKACEEANIYKKYNLDGLLIENMHDIPYAKTSNIGPEITACMTRIATEIRHIIPKSIPIGVQVLAGGNTHALSIAKACNLQFTRVEGFVFGHIADEGYMDACASELLRFRRNIDAQDILVFTDIKKKHCSHSITNDTPLLETAKAAEFFLTDGIILTGVSTGEVVNLDELNSLDGKLNCPILIGSGATTNNIERYFNQIDAVIIGSHFKKLGTWKNDICEETVCKFMEKVMNLRNKKT